ncbi:MAG: molybdenum cofactor guanylyltransferase [Ignavibacteriales bacterium]|nr:molybdenum cofactor guanylyltransferase [Ignavibacteriales bacterium]
MTKRSDVLGAVLAGGKSTRMGTEKALLPVKGRPMIQYAAETLAKVFAETVIVGGSQDKYGFLKCEIVPDLFEGCGPLGGIHAALHRSKPRAAFVLSCDTPFIPADLIEFLLRAKAPDLTVIATFDGVLQPLCGVYDASSFPEIDRDIEQGKYSVFKTLKNIEHVEIPITPDLPFFTPQLFWNMNRPEDYRILSQPDAGTSHG